VVDLWGGVAMRAADAEALLKRTGFSTVRTIAGPPWAPVPVVAQK
jgi:hypothetical protein